MILDTFKIKLIMAEKEMDIAEMAKRCEITRQNLGRVINHGSCRPKTAGILARALGVDVREIVKEA